jgi:cytochrome c-type biogenesis protein CcmH/NrfG
VKTDLLFAVGRFGTVLQLLTWLAIAAALYLTGYGVWLAVAAIRAAFTRAHQTIADIQQPREEKP